MVLDAFDAEIARIESTVQLTSSNQVLDNFENMIEKVCHEAMPRIIKKYLNEGFIKLPKQVETEIRVF